MQINSVNAGQYAPFTDTKVNTTAGNTNDAKEQQLLSDEYTLVPDEYTPPTPWTIEEFKSAGRLLYLGQEPDESMSDRIRQLHDAGELKKARSAEIYRMACTQERTNQFEITLLHFSSGFNEPDIFFNLGTSLYNERAIILENRGGFLTDAEIQNRLDRLYQQFDQAFSDLARKITRDSNVASAIKKLGEAIKNYVLSGNAIEWDSKPSAFYNIMARTANTPMSIHTLNAIAFAWHSPYG